MVRILSLAGALALAVPLVNSTASIAQDVTGRPGAPNATVTIEGDQLPPLPPQFGGVIKERGSESTPWWPPRVVPPKGAPNVLLILTDDQGYGVYSTFGGVIPAPSHGLDRRGGTALHAVPFDGALLAHARCAAHRPQPSFGWLRTW